MILDSRRSSTLELTVDAEHPWPGLASFREQDREFYRGRRRETEELLRLVRRAQLTVLFGPSGLGKTSLLQAGVFHELRQENYLPVFMRMAYGPDGPTPVAQVRAAITAAAAAHGLDAPAFREGETLWESFHRQDADFWSANDDLVTPVLVFDQFEELFTVGRGRAQELVQQLGDLIEGRIPESVTAQLERHPERAQDFTFNRHRYKVILSLREDFLADLEGLRDQIPAIAHNRFRLQPLLGAQALEVVIGAGGPLVRDATAERIIRFVAGEHAHGADALAGLEIEPALLSLVCRELNEQRLQRGSPEITADLLEGTGKEILTGFYERTFQEVRPKAVAAEARWFIEEKLITASGYRDSVALDNLPASMNDTVLGQLVDRRLLRVDERGRTRRVELTHDVLTDVVREGRDRRRLRQRAMGRRRRVAVAFVTLGLAYLITAGLYYKSREQTKRIAALNELINTKNWVLVRKQFVRAAKEAASRGLVRRDSLMGYLESHQSETLPLTLDSSSRFLYGACDRDCSDLNLALHTADGRLVGLDTLKDDQPVIDIPAGTAGPHRVTISMIHCSIPPCFYGVLVFSDTATLALQTKAKRK